MTLRGLLRELRKRRERMTAEILRHDSGASSERQEDEAMPCAVTRPEPEDITS